MRRLATSIAPTVVTGIAGLLTFVSLFVPALAPLRGALVSIAVIIAGFAVVLGFFHLVLGVHVQRIRQGKGALYSLVLILAAGVTAGLMIAERLLGTPDYPAGAFIFNNIVMPMQSAPCSTASATSSRSFSVTAGALTSTSGRLRPLWSR